MSLTQPYRIYTPWKPGCLMARGMSGGCQPWPVQLSSGLNEPPGGPGCERLRPPQPEREADTEARLHASSQKATEGQQPNPKSPGPYLVCIAELGHLVSVVEGLPDEKRARSPPSREMPGQVGTWPATELTYQATALSTLALSPPIPTSVSLTKGYKAPAVR